VQEKDDVFNAVFPKCLIMIENGVEAGNVGRRKDISWLDQGRWD
jgi:hypothetical protein